MPPHRQRCSNDVGIGAACVDVPLGRRLPSTFVFSEQTYSTPIPSAREITHPTERATACSSAAQAASPGPGRAVSTKISFRLARREISVQSPHPAYTSSPYVTALSNTHHIIIYTNNSLRGAVEGRNQEQICFKCSKTIRMSKLVPGGISDDKYRMRTDLD